MKIDKVNNLPVTLDPDTIYLLKDVNEEITCHVSDNVGSTTDNISTNREIKIDGSKTISLNQTLNYTITNYDSFTTYSVTALSGSVSILNDVITYTAPATIQQPGFKINNDTFVLTLV